MTPLHFIFIFKGRFAANIFRFGSHSWLFCLTEFGVIEFSRVDFIEFGVLEFSGIVRILFSCVLARLEFAVLVIFIFRLGSKLPCLFPFLFYFLVYPVPFRFSWTPCRFFSCFVWSNLICWHLTLVVGALVLDVCFPSI